MNLPSNVISESTMRWESSAAAISPARRFGWSLRRELWENRFVYIAPLAVSAIFLLGFFISLAGLPERMRAALALESIAQRQAVEQPYVAAAMVLMAIALIVAVVYCLDAFYGERRDRSVLFWKSLPVSDLTTVLAKASVPILVIPSIAWALTVATQSIMLLASSAVLSANGVSAAAMWTHVPPLKTSALNFAHLVMYHGLWYAPFYGWLLMVSAWANRAPFLWATLPPLAVGVLEKVAFNSSHVAGIVRFRFMGDSAGETQAGGMTMDMLGPHSPLHYLTRPGLWLGLAFAAAFLFAAVRLRRSRLPI